MGGVFDGFKAWQAAVVVVLLVGIGGGVYAGYAAVTGSDGASVNDGDTSIPVQRGDLVLQVSTDGQVTFPLTETVAFDVQGTVGEVLVEVGDTVAVGDVLARLSDRDVAGLAAVAAAARVDVAEARDALAAELDPVDPLVVAEAQARVADSRQDLESAVDALADLREPSDAEVAASRLAVAEASVRLADARERLGDLVADPGEDAMASATTAVRIAEETLANELTRAELDEAARIDAASDAADAATDAITDYRETFDLWLGVDLAVFDPAVSDPNAVLAAMGADLAALFDGANTSDQLGFEGASAGLPDDDPSTAWNEEVVFVWLSLFPGDVALTVGDGDPVAGTRYVADELDQSWEAVQAAIDAADAQGAAAAVARTAEGTRIERAKTGVEVATTALQELLDGADPADVEVAVQRVAFAVEDAREIEEALALLLAGPDKLDIDRLGSRVVVAQEVLASAEAALVDSLAGPDADRVALRQAQLDAAVLAIDAAEDNLAAAVLTSPYAGVVTELMIEAGDQVGRNAPVAVVVDQSVVEVVGTVDEIDVLQVAEGALATVALDALGGATLPGVVTFIAAKPDQGQVVTYEIQVTVQVPDGVSLLEGLTATVTIVTSRQTGVLLVPNNAVGGSVIQPTVRVDGGGSVEERPVTLGESDGFWTVVLAGLREGEMVLIEGSSSASQTEGFGAIRGLVGGGGFDFGGGGRGGDRQAAGAGGGR